MESNVCVWETMSAGSRSFCRRAMSEYQLMEKGPITESLILISHRETQRNWVT